MVGINAEQRVPQKTAQRKIEVDLLSQPRRAVQYFRRRAVQVGMHQTQQEHQRARHEDGNGQAQVPAHDQSIDGRRIGTPASQKVRAQGIPRQHEKYAHGGTPLKDKRQPRAVDPRHHGGQHFMKLVVQQHAEGRPAADTVDFQRAGMGCRRHARRSAALWCWTIIPGCGEGLQTSVWQVRVCRRR